MNQTLHDIEIICINDGSTDDSSQIIENMAKQDSRIRIVNKSNTGYGHTMNMGIDLAEGKYIIFLESDDFILPDMCQVLYKKCEEHNLEIIKTDFFEFKERKDKIYSRYQVVSAHNNYHEVLSPKSSPNLFFTCMYTWTCMYKREYINKYKIRHNESPGASYQDNGFWFQSLMYCERMYLLDQAFYMYRQDNPNSSIYSKGKVRAFSNEYAFIRGKIDEYEGEKKRFFKICAYFNINHNLISLKRVDRVHTEELIQLICRDFEWYARRKVWNVKDMGIDFLKKVMICLLQPEDLRDEVWRYIEKDSARREILNKYNTYILYGAGVYARRTFPILEECKMWDKEVLCGVTLLKNKGEKIEGIEIRQMQELLQYKETALVIVCAKKESDNYRQMCHNLENWGMKHVIHTNDLIVDDFWNAF